MYYILLLYRFSDIRMWHQHTVYIYMYAPDSNIIVVVLKILTEFDI